MAHASDSAVQRDAEAVIREALSRKVRRKLHPKSLTLPNGARVDIDGVDRSESIFVEIFAHHGRPKGGQLHKISTDALKLITLVRDRPGSRCILAFADEDAAAAIQGRSWRAEALRTWDVEVVVVQIDSTTRDGIRAAQVRQVMLNPE